MAMVLLSAICYNLPRFWEWQIGTNSIDGLPEQQPFLRYSYYYYYIYFTGLYIFTHFFFPLALIVKLNVSVVATMIKASQQRGQIGATTTTNESTSTDHSTSLMMISIIITFIACNFLLLVTNVMEALDRDIFRDKQKAAVAYLLNDISNCLVLLNSSTTAFIYAAFCRRYRHIAAHLFQCRTAAQLPPSALQRRQTNGNVAESLLSLSTLNGKTNDPSPNHPRPRVHARVLRQGSNSHQDISLSLNPPQPDPRTHSF